MLLLLNCFSRVRLCATPQTAAHQAPPSLGFSRQEHRSGLPFPSPMHETEKWKWSHSVVSDSLQPHGLQPTRLLRPWDFPGESTGVGCHAFSKGAWGQRNNSFLCRLAQGIFNSKNLWVSSYCYFILGVLIYCSSFLLFKFTHKPTVDNPQLSGMHITMYAHL